MYPLVTVYYIIFFSNHPRQILWIFCGASSGSYESSASPGWEIFLGWPCPTIAQNSSHKTAFCLELLRFTSNTFALRLLRPAIGIATRRRVSVYCTTCGSAGGGYKRGDNSVIGGFSHLDSIPLGSWPLHKTCNLNSYPLKPNKYHRNHPSLAIHCVIKLVWLLLT